MVIPLRFRIIINRLVWIFEGQLFEINGDIIHLDRSSTSDAHVSNTLYLNRAVEYCKSIALIVIARFLAL